MGIDIRHLEAFLAAAEEHSITRAARRLHQTQPALSRTISQLEQHVGACLLLRSPQGVELTPAGESFRSKALRAVNAFTEAAHDPFSAPRPLRVGHAWAALGAFTTQVIQTWRARHPESDLKLHRLDDLYAHLNEGSVDLCVVRGRPPGSVYHRELLYSEGRVAALTTGHPLADHDVIALSALSHERLVVNTASGTTELDMWGEQGRPYIGAEVATIDDWLSNIAAGNGIGITPTSSAQLYHHAEISYVRLSDAPPVAVYLTWLPNCRHPALNDFIQTVKTLTNPAPVPPRGNPP
jgi:DNA-binding transcriptional LysR family regulator